MEREDTPNELLLTRVWFVLTVGLILTALIMLGIFEDNEDIGPCEQYQSQEAFELCADSVYNG
jgi:hypothetical protein